MRVKGACLQQHRMAIGRPSGLDDDIYRGLIEPHSLTGERPGVTTDRSTPPDDRDAPA